MEDLADKLDGRGGVGVVFVERHEQAEGPVFKWGVRYGSDDEHDQIEVQLRGRRSEMTERQKLAWTKDDGVPDHDVIRLGSSRDARRGVCLESSKVPDQTSSCGGGLQDHQGHHISVRDVADRVICEMRDVLGLP